MCSPGGFRLGIKLRIFCCGWCVCFVVRKAWEKKAVEQVTVFAMFTQVFEQNALTFEKRFLMRTAHCAKRRAHLPKTEALCTLVGRAGRA